MLNYLARRLLQLIPTLLIVSIVVFWLVRGLGNPVHLMLPEDASPEQIEALTAALKLDQPIPVQYWHFLVGLAKGDFGQSLRYQAPALPLVLERIPVTMALAGSTAIVSIVLAVPLGVYAALRRNRLGDLFATFLATVGRTMPNFWLGTLLILLFSVWLRWLPVSGYGTWKHYIMPVAALSANLTATLTRLVRSSLLEVIHSDFVRTARAKGLSEMKVVFKHALRPTLIPVLTVWGLQVATLIEGAVVTETLFALPGSGRLMVTSLGSIDFPVVQAGVLLSVLVVVASNFLVDVLYSIVDPRIRYS